VEVSVVKIYVGNLSFSATEDDVRGAFEAHGNVSSVSLVMDRATGRSRGFAFVEMPNGGEANAAIKALNLQTIGDRAITVNEARPREDRPRSGGGGHRGGGGRGRW
jgi:RNA recognition motif-containing protein